MKTSITTDKTTASLRIEAGPEELAPLKSQVLEQLRSQVSAPGFRKGTAPIQMVEKQVDSNYLKSQFLEHALANLYSRAVVDKKLRPVSQPQVEIEKFVPYSALEFTATVEVLPEITLPDYKSFKVPIESVSVTKDDIQEVLENLRQRLAKKTPMPDGGAAQEGDEVIITFSAVDDKEQKVNGADGNEYPLLLGSGTFIPGFEEHLMGTKRDEELRFPITFPDDYAHTPLAGKKVMFTVKIDNVNKVTLPELDDSFAKEAGPFETVDDLKADIKQQLTKQKKQDAMVKQKDSILELLAGKAEFLPPKSLVEESIESLMQDFKQNLLYRGITLNDYLAQTGQTEEEYRAKELQQKAESRVKIGLMLAEVSRVEGLVVEPEELELQIDLLKGKYANDQNLQTQLNSENGKKEVASRMLTEKTINKLAEYAS